MKKERPVLDLPKADSDIENFQNEVLRPILKQNHDRFVLVFEQHLVKRKKSLELLSTKEKSQLINNLLKKDAQLSNILLGIVLGDLEMDELKSYFMHASESNRRCISMLVQRFESVFCQDS